MRVFIVVFVLRVGKVGSADAEDEDVEEHGLIGGGCEELKQWKLGLRRVMRLELRF